MIIGMKDIDDKIEEEWDKTFSNAFDGVFNTPHPFEELEAPPLYICKFCGNYTDREPEEQEAPADYCHPEDHM